MEKSHQRRSLLLILLTTALLLYDTSSAHRHKEPRRKRSPQNNILYRSSDIWQPSSSNSKYEDLDKQLSKVFTKVVIDPNASETKRSEIEHVINDFTDDTDGATIVIENDNKEDTVDKEADASKKSGISIEEPDETDGAGYSIVLETNNDPEASETKREREIREMKVDTDRMDKRFSNLLGDKDLKRVKVMVLTPKSASHGLGSIRSSVKTVDPVLNPTKPSEKPTHKSSLFIEPATIDDTIRKDVTDIAESSLADQIDKLKHVKEKLTLLNEDNDDTLHRLRVSSRLANSLSNDLEEKVTTDDANAIVRETMKHIDFTRPVHDEALSKESSDEDLSDSKASHELANVEIQEKPNHLDSDFIRAQEAMKKIKILKGQIIKDNHKTGQGSELLMESGQNSDRSIYPLESGETVTHGSHNSNQHDIPMLKDLTETSVRRVSVVRNDSDSEYSSDLHGEKDYSSLRPIKSPLRSRTDEGENAHISIVSDDSAEGKSKQQSGYARELDSSTQEYNHSKTLSSGNDSGNTEATMKSMKGVGFSKLVPPTNPAPNPNFDDMQLLMSKQSAKKVINSKTGAVVDGKFARLHRPGFALDHLSKMGDMVGVSEKKQISDDNSSPKALTTGDNIDKDITPDSSATRGSTSDLGTEVRVDSNGDDSAQKRKPTAPATLPTKHPTVAISQSESAMRGEKILNVRKAKAILEYLNKDPLESWRYHYTTLKSLGLNSTILRSGLVNAGNIDRLKGVMKRALKGKDITLSIVGGSISAGGGIYKDYGNINGLYYKGVVDWWNKMISPLTGSDMIVNNVAIGSIGTDYFSYCLKSHVSNDSDIVLWELSGNDYNRYKNMPTKGARPLERLTRMILELQNKPALLYVNFFKGVDYKQSRISCPNFEDQGEDVIAHYYKIPSLSWRAMVCEPLIHKEKEFTLHELFSRDQFHPSLKAHAQTALLLLLHLRHVMRAVLQWAIEHDGYLETFEEHYVLPIPLFLGPSYPEPLCWTLISPDTSGRIYNSLKVHVVKDDGFKLEYATNFPIRYDRVVCWKAERPGAEISLQFTIPENYGNSGNKRLRNDIVITTHTRWGGAANLWIDQKTSAPLLLKEGRPNDPGKRTQVDTVEHDITPGTHTLNVRSMDGGFCLSAIMIDGT